MKKISVLISAYNSAEFIKDVFESIIIQKIPLNYCLEVIVGIDGCENTWNEVLKFQHKNFCFIKMTKNYGTYITFNTLMNYASGDLIARFDADDIMLDNYLSDQINVLESENDINLTRTWSIYTNKQKRPIEHILHDGTCTSVAGERQKGSDGQFMMRKKVWQVLGAFKPWICFADTDFFIRCKFSGFKLYEVEKYLYLRRIHENSLTQSLETGYNSEIRNRYKEILRQESSNFKSTEDCYINPHVGNIETIRYY
jgi:glycosyltransferase involved in cell wall biosynthesis